MRKFSVACFICILLLLGYLIGFAEVSTEGRVYDEPMTNDDLFMMSPVGLTTQFLLRDLAEKYKEVLTDEDEFLWRNFFDRLSIVPTYAEWRELLLDLLSCENPEGFKKIIRAPYLEITESKTAPHRNQVLTQTKIVLDDAGFDLPYLFAQKWPYLERGAALWSVDVGNWPPDNYVNVHIHFDEQLSLFKMTSIDMQYARQESIPPPFRIIEQAFVFAKTYEREGKLEDERLYEAYSFYNKEVGEEIFCLWFYGQPGVKDNKNVEEMSGVFVAIGEKSGKIFHFFDSESYSSFKMLRDYDPIQEEE